MPSPLMFRLSTYLTLILACVCLGYAEWDLLREATFLSGAVILSLLVSFWNEGKRELSLEAANRVGLGIGVVGAAWLGYQFVNKDSLIHTFPWPASLLPYLGPLLMVLMPAKLFRPKHVGDWWAMQGIALAAAGLAAAMSEDALFGALLAAYALAATWSLGIFYFHRVGGTLPPVPHTDPGPRPVVVHSHGGNRTAGLGPLRQAAGWLAAAAVLALPAFFLTPRSDASRWQFIRPRLETGYAAEQMINLNQSGELKVNREVAFELTATNPDGTPYADLDPGQRWRGVAFTNYKDGKWGVGQSVQPLMTPAPASRGQVVFTPPDFGPGQVRLDFTAKAFTARPILADPVTWRADQPSPAGTVTDAEPLAWRQADDGSFQAIALTTKRVRLPRHRQIFLPRAGPDADLGPPFALNEGVRVDQADRGESPAIALLRATGTPGVERFAVRLLRRLAQGSPPLAEALGRARAESHFRLDPRDYEAVGRAFARHLAESGEYEYTLDLRRVNRDLDPVEEFLTVTKSGHCQRYAAGLVLMLRSLGVPAAYVLGFKGWDAGEAEGTYAIRQEHAHAWAEALVPRPEPGGKTAWHWLSLDPTTAIGASATPEPSSWLGSARDSGAAFVLNFIIGYDKQRQKAALDAAQAWLAARGGVLALAAIGGGLALFAGSRLTRRTWRRRNLGAGPDALEAAPWYGELVQVLTAAGFPRVPGQTYAEWAAAAEGGVRNRLADRDIASVIDRATAAFYALRYAGHGPDAAELAALRADLGRLREALRAGADLG